MPIEIIDLDQGRGNIIKGSGVVTGKEFVTVLKKHLTQREERFSQYRYSISDYTAVVGEEVQKDDIKEIIYFCAQAAQINPDLVVAVIADQDITYGLSRMWEILMNGVDWEIRIIRDGDTAHEWVGSRVKELFGINDLTFQPV